MVYGSKGLHRFREWVFIGAVRLSPVLIGFPFSVGRNAGGSTFAERCSLVSGAFSSCSSATFLCSSVTLSVF